MGPELRLKILDRAILNGQNPSWTKFAQHCTEGGENVWKSKRTFEDDIKRLKQELVKRFPNVLEKHLIFSKIKSGFQYHPDVSGLADISRTEIDQLVELSKDLLNSRNLLITDTARNLLERLTTIAKVEDFENQRSPFRWAPIEFMLEGRRQGQRHVEDLILAITELRPVTMIYRAYQKPTKEYQILPLLLKEWDNAWYLLVKRLENESGTIHLKLAELQLFALDRIQDLSIQNNSLKRKIKNLSSFQASNYFKNVYGVWNSNLNKEHEADKVHRIVLETQSPWHYGYLLNNPIHASKKILINEEETRHIKIQIQCQINPDLISLLLRFFPEIKVLSPKQVKTVLKQRINNMAIYI